MRKLLNTIIILVILSGCASGEFENRRLAAGNGFERDIELATEKAESQMVAPNCENAKIANKTIKGHFFNAGKCGTLSEYLLSQGKLKEEICPPLKLKGKACEKKIYETFTARLEDRYSLLSLVGADKNCKLYPTKCKSMFEFELMILTIHNDDIQAQYMEEIDRISEGYSQRLRAINREESEESSRAAASALSAMGAAFQNASSPPQQTSYQPPQCVGLPPLAPYGCRMVCINGSWSSVCN